MPDRIPTRSTAVPRPHGPTKARRPHGDLHGAPTAVPYQVTRIPLVVEQLPDGLWRFTSPIAPGWSAAAVASRDLAPIVRSAFTEVQVEAYSEWRRTSLRRHQPAVHTRRRSRKRCDVYAATEWKLAEPGVWISPKGLRYPEDRQVVQRVMTAREKLGLAARPDPTDQEGAA